MAQTDARAGFRLPWSSDRPSADPSEGDPTEQTQANTSATWPTQDTAPTANAVASSEAEADTTKVDPWAGMPTSQPPSGSGPTPPARKPSKFLADLTKAMQAAAEEARGLALSQLQADAKAFVEGVHGRSSTEAANLRRGADDDVAAVREWSKAEIARIREETEARITKRKARLESEIDEHAGIIEREIDAVQKTVAAFEDEMAAFFERLNAEEDPTRFATMAENLPEPPTFEGISVAPAVADQADVEATETTDPTEEAPAVEASTGESDGAGASDDAEGSVGS
jgi:hypothetical protein